MKQNSNIKPGKLYLVPTPIGNLEDITFRALRVLKEVDLILAEDTRTSGILLKKYEINTPMQSHHKFNEHFTTEGVCEKILQGKNIALISDAGSPGISDPGFFLTRSCREKGIDVEALPGPTAFVPALTASGLPSDKFCFEGFLPQKKGRQTILKEIGKDPRTTILYESPFRLVKTLQQIAEFISPLREVVVCRELTKIHEEYKRGLPFELISYYKQHEPKGEIVIIIEGKSEKDNDVKDEERENEKRVKKNQQRKDLCREG